MDVIATEKAIVLLLLEADSSDNRAHHFFRHAQTGALSCRTGSDLFPSPISPVRRRAIFEMLEDDQLVLGPANPAGMQPIVLNELIVPPMPILPSELKPMEFRI